MAVKVTPGVCTVVTGEDIDKLRIIALAGALSLELHGLRRRGRSVYAIVKSEFGLRGNRRSVYEQFCKMHGLEPRGPVQETDRADASQRTKD